MPHRRCGCARQIFSHSHTHTSTLSEVFYCIATTLSLSIEFYSDLQWLQSSNTRSSNLIDTPRSSLSLFHGTQRSCWRATKESRTLVRRNNPNSRCGHFQTVSGTIFFSSFLLTRPLFLGFW